MRNFSIRLEDLQIRMVSAVAEAYGMKPSQILRIALDIGLQNLPQAMRDRADSAASALKQTRANSKTS